MKPARIAALGVAAALTVAAPFLASAQTASDSATGAQRAERFAQKHDGPGCAHFARGRHHATAGGHGPRGQWAQRGHFLRGLDLSDAQRDRIFEIRHAAAPQMREQARVLRQTRGEVSKLALSNEYDEAALKVLADRRAQAMSAIAQLRAHNLNQIYQTLTPEQQAKLQERQSRRTGRS